MENGKYFPFSIFHQKSMLRIGITGGIGSGKTTVCRIFESLGIPVYYADEWAKWLTVHDPAVKSGIVAEFGENAYVDGQYNRAFIAGIVFKDAARLQVLNGLIHPALEQHSRHWHAQQDASLPYTLKEAALMIESGSYRFLDHLIMVTAPESLRIQRVMQRDGISEADVKARIARQMPESEKLAYANVVIHNDASRSLVAQVWKIHQQFKQMSASSDFINS